MMERPDALKTDFKSVPNASPGEDGAETAK